MKSVNNRLKQVMAIVGIIVLLTGQICSSQDIPKMSNVILVKSALSDTELYKKNGQLLISEGFILRRSDGDFLQIQSEARIGRREEYRPRLSIAVLSGVVKITGYFGVEIATTDAARSDSRITKRGMKGSPFAVTFDVMNDYAEKLSKLVLFQFSLYIDRPDSLGLPEHTTG